MSVNTKRTLSDSFSIAQNTNYKSRRAKLKKSLIDAASTNGYSNYQEFSKACTSNKLVLLNAKQTKQYFTMLGNRLPIDAIMTSCDFIGIVGKDEMNLYFRVPERARPFLDDQTFQNETINIPKPPQRSMTPGARSRPSIRNDLSDDMRSQTINDNLSIHSSTNKLRLKSRNNSIVSEKKLIPEPPVFKKPETQKRSQSLCIDKKHTLEDLKEEEELYPMPNPQFRNYVIEYKSKPITNGDSYDDRLLLLIHDLQAAYIDYKYLFDMLKVAMTTLGDNKGSLPRDIYERECGLLKRQVGPQFFDRVIELSLSPQGRVDLALLTRIVESYKYTPSMNKRHKNASEQFQRLALFGGEGSDSTVTYKNYKLLSYKIEEKFDELRKAFRFFDLDKNGNITLSNFKCGLDLLSMRLDAKEVKSLFHFLDKKGDGILDYDEFCDILEDRRLLKESINSTYDLITGKLKRTRVSNPHLKFMTPKVKEEPKFDDSKEPTGRGSDGFISLEHSRFSASNVLLQKSILGASKKFGFDLPVESDYYGIKSMPTEQMKDILAGNFQREWIENQRDMEIKRRQKKINESQKEKRVNTQATVLRNEFIRKTLDLKSNGKTFSKIELEDYAANPLWKMSRFTNTRPKVRVKRKEIGDDRRNRSMDMTVKRFNETFS